MYCKNCGKKLKGEAFCTSCGTKVSDTSQIIQTENVAENVTENIAETNNIPEQINNTDNGDTVVQEQSPAPQAQVTQDVRSKISPKVIAISAGALAVLVLIIVLLSNGGGVNFKNCMKSTAFSHGQVWQMTVPI